MTDKLSDPNLSVQPASAMNVYQGQIWEWVKIPASEASQIPGENVVDCDFLSSEDGWAVGISGLISHWNGSNWTPSAYHIPAFLNGLNDVAMVATDDVWAVGEGGLIIHWDGKEWKDFSFSTEDDLFGISFTSPDSGFAVGGPMMTDKKDRLVLHWDGKQWSKVPFFKPSIEEEALPWLTAVQMVSEKNGWISGNGKLYRWDGTNWNVYSQQNEKNLYFIVNEFSKLDSNNIWAAGYLNNHDTILHWDGSRWNDSYESKPYMLVSIQMISPSFGWAVGILPNGMRTDSSTNSVIYTWDGTNWSEQPISEKIFHDKSSSLNRVCAFDKYHAWVFGNDQGTPIAFRYTEKPTLTPSATPTLALSATFVSTSVLTPTHPNLKTIELTKITPNSNEKMNQYNSILWKGVFLLIIALMILFVFVIRVQRK